jgi:hypothetical protein
MCGEDQGKRGNPPRRWRWVADGFRGRRVCLRVCAFVRGWVGWIFLVGDLPRITGDGWDPLQCAETDTRILRKGTDGWLVSRLSSLISPLLHHTRREREREREAEMARV